MEDNYSLVIIFLIILAGSLFIGVRNITNKEIMNIIYKETNITYEAVIYRNNKIKVTKQDCSEELCFIDSFNEKGTHIKDFINYVETLENNFLPYDELKEYSYIVYLNKENTALYDDTLENDSLLRTKLKQLLER